MKRRLRISFTEPLNWDPDDWEKYLEMIKTIYDVGITFDIEEDQYLLIGDVQIELLLSLGIRIGMLRANGSEVKTYLTTI